MRRIFSLLLLIFLFGVNKGEAESLLSLSKAVDWSCAELKIVGVCTRPEPPYVGIRVRYWQPALLIETVKMPGDSAIDGLGKIISPIVSGTAEKLLGKATGLTIPISSGNNYSPTSTSKLQFNEVHIYNFPFMNIFSAMTAFECKNVSEPVGIKYLSELDSAEWRIGLLETLHPKSMLSFALGPICSVLGRYDRGLCMGTWGSLYPRRGFLTHQSEVVGSAGCAFRATSIASLDGVLSHVVLSPVTFMPDASKDKLQQLFPNPGGCFDIGKNPMQWESRKLSLNGKYVWTYWRHRECCVF